jgi:cell division protein FtsB
MKHKITIISLALVLTVSPAFAQLGSGIVFDPTNYKNAVLRYLQLQQQLQQLQQTYSLYMQQYQFLQGQARQLQGMVGRYRAQFSQWQNLTASNTLGNTSWWVGGINSGDYGTAKQGYSQINMTLGNPAGVNTYDSLKRAYGLEELSDGSTVNGMATIGKLRQNAQQLEIHIKQLEDDSLSSAPDMNTQIAVLNKINAANVLLVRTMQDTNKLLAALLEQQLVTTERNRTSSVGSINTELYRQQHFADVMSFTSSMPTRLQTPTGK